MFLSLLLVGHSHPKLLNTFEERLGMLGSGHILTTPDQVPHVLINAAEKKISQVKAGPSFKAENGPNTKQENVFHTSKSRLLNRLLETFNCPDKLQTALAFSSG